MTMADKPEEPSSSHTQSTLGKRSHEEDSSFSDKRPATANRVSTENNVLGSGVEGEEKGSENQKDEKALKKKGTKKGAGKSRKAFKAENRDNRRGTRPEKSTGEGLGEEDDGQDKAERLPKRVCALLIGFCGEGYNGMQMFVLVFVPYLSHE